MGAAGRRLGTPGARTGVPGIVLICYSNLASGGPAAETGHDLVRDRAQGVGPVLGGGFARIADAEQHDLVSHPRGLVPEIHDELVHAHGAGDRPAPATDVHFGEPERTARDAL